MRVYLNDENFKVNSKIAKKKVFKKKYKKKYEKKEQQIYELLKPTYIGTNNRFADNPYIVTFGEF